MRITRLSHSRNSIPAKTRRQAARKSTCQNHLSQIGVAIANYDMAFEVLPPGVVNPTGPIRSEDPPAADEYHVSWIVQILP
ncbi:MAG: DUF1559 domain-containing protein, partial [Verrucomicrobiae bacterium]|nr:DUF1559 domain-containing protein [Verrucomicrobiae bacterium]